MDTENAASMAYGLLKKIMFYEPPMVGRALARAFGTWYQGGLDLATLDPTAFDDGAVQLLRQLLALPRTGDARHETVLQIGAQMLRGVADGHGVSIPDTFRLYSTAADDDAD